MGKIENVAKRRPSLVADAEIDRLVRQFAARVLFLRAAWHRGEDGTQNPLQAIEREARGARRKRSHRAHAAWTGALHVPAS